VTASWRDAYRGKRVLVTGHTGFKGSWLSLWLSQIGADVTGFALPPATDPSMFAAAKVGTVIRHVEGDVRDLRALREVWNACRPDVVFHLAAQPIVRESYRQPVETITTNVVGTTHVLELARESRGPLALVCITSDKCYENVEVPYGYREDDRLGGADVYSGSKAAAEILISSYRRSFFSQPGAPAVASVRAGNVIGGGDWASDRLVPDAVRALAARQTIHVRNPKSVRPWQHVLEPLSGYLTVGARLQQTDAGGLSARSAWNFGPTIPNARSVADVVDGIIREWGSGRWEQPPADGGGHEATLLRLAIDRAQLLLGWGPRWDFDETMKRTVEWYREYYKGGDVLACAARQIADYTNAPIARNNPVVTAI
jgi:CDP-glucose 4,6-dehydratase